MGKGHGSDGSDWRRKAREKGASEHMKGVQRRNKCPACARKGAMSTIAPLYPGEPRIRVCRYCKHEENDHGATP